METLKKITVVVFTFLGGIGTIAGIVFIPYFIGGIYSASEHLVIQWVKGAIALFSTITVESFGIVVIVYIFHFVYRTITPTINNTFNAIEVKNLKRYELKIKEHMIGNLSIKDTKEDEGKLSLI